MRRRRLNSFLAKGLSSAGARVNRAAITRARTGKKTDARETVAKKEEENSGYSIAAAVRNATEPQVEKKNRKLTPRQRRLLKALPHAKTIAEAGRIAGYSARQATNQALRNLREKMPEMLDRLGLTDERIIDDCLRPGLFATETRFLAHEGRVTETVEVIDHPTRHKFLTTYLTLRGHLNRGSKGEAAGIGKDAAISINLSFVIPETARSLLAITDVNRGPGDANDENRGSTGLQAEPEPERR
jgi:hypothetical protein